MRSADVDRLTQFIHVQGVLFKQGEAVGRDGGEGGRFPIIEVG